MKSETFFKNHAFQTLFLDRDGVINQRTKGGYIGHPDQFIFLDGVLLALATLTKYFEFIFVVTNQQGVGKATISEADLTSIHLKMLQEVKAAGGRIDGVYHCPHLTALQCDCRKPKTGMPLQAQRDFPQVDFSRSVMVGDFFTDIQMGKALGMHCVFVDTADDLPAAKQQEAKALADQTVSGLQEWTFMGEQPIQNQ